MKRGGHSSDHGDDLGEVDRVHSTELFFFKLFKNKTNSIEVWDEGDGVGVSGNDFALSQKSDARRTAMAELDALGRKMLFLLLLFCYCSW